MDWTEKQIEQARIDMLSVDYSCITAYNDFLRTYGIDENSTEIDRIKFWIAIYEWVEKNEGIVYSGRMNFFKRALVKVKECTRSLQ